MRHLKLLKSLLDNKSLQDKKIVHYCSLCPRKRANAAFLMGCFSLLMLKRGAGEEAGNAPFCRSQEKFHTVVLRGPRNISEAP